MERIKICKNANTCGNCIFMENEDINGNGYCEKYDRLVSCSDICLRFFEEKEEMKEDEDKERLAYNTDADLKKALGGWIHDTMEENCIQDAELEIIIKEYK